MIYRCFPPENSSWTIPKVSREIKRLARMLTSLFRYVYCSSQVSGRNIEFKHKVRRRDMKYEVVIFHSRWFEANSMALKPLLVYEYVPTSFPIKILNYDINCMKIVYNFAWMSCKQSSSLCKRWDIKSCVGDLMTSYFRLEFESEATTAWKSDMPIKTSCNKLEQCHPSCEDQHIFHLI